MSEGQTQVRPFAAVLRDQRRGQTLQDLSEALAGLVQAVTEHGKPGTLTLKLTVRPAPKGDDRVVSLTDAITVKAPVGERGEWIFYADEAGNLSRRDPRQPELPFDVVDGGAGREFNEGHRGGAGGMNSGESIEAKLEHVDGFGVGEIIRVAQEAVEPLKAEPGTILAYRVAEGARVEVIDLEGSLYRPRRKTGWVAFHRAASLSAYVNVHNSDDSMEGEHAAGRTAWADINARTITAVLNDHDSGDTGWRDHVAVLRLPHPPAWAAWVGANQRSMTQVEFAEFVEDHLPDIADPPGADLLELSFSSDQRLASGQVQLAYVEEVEATAGRKGTLEVPSTFTLSLAPFEGTDPEPITARLRYRVSDGQLRIGYVLDRPEELLRAAFDRIVAEVEGATGITVWFGDPRIEHTPGHQTGGNVSINFTGTGGA